MDEIMKPIMHVTLNPLFIRELDYPSAHIMFPDVVDGDAMLKRLERIARVAYKTEEYIKEGSDRVLLNKILKSGHESVIEHESVTVLWKVDRAMSHEIVRHRIAAYTQESQRYCNYNKKGYEVIVPLYLRDKKSSPEYMEWQNAVLSVITRYQQWVDSGVKPEQARAVLPNCMATTLVSTMNLREWRHFFQLRAIDTSSNHPYPPIKEVSSNLLEEFKAKIPLIFDDIA